VVLEIARQYPLVVVGVAQPAATFDAASLDDRPRAGGYLLTRTLVEFVERGPEGGAYASPWGTVQQSSDRLELIFELRPQPASVSRVRSVPRIAGDGRPGFARVSASWASLMSEVQGPERRRVRVKLRHPTCCRRPCLQVQLRLGAASRALPRGVASDGETRFEPAGEPVAGAEPSPVIVEGFYAEPRTAIEDLRKGKIDAIGPLLPTDACDCGTTIRCTWPPTLSVDHC